MHKVVVMGAGSWGTSLAILLAEKGNTVTLWEYDKEKAEKIQRERINPLYLPGINFPDNLVVTNELDGLLKDAEFLVFSIPSQALRSVVRLVSDQLNDNITLVNTGKGIELGSNMRLSEVIASEIDPKFANNIVVLSGPTHAEEVARKRPTVILAAGDSEKAKIVQELFNTSSFRVYYGNDRIGVEIGGAIKNCLAIAAGICDGMELGDNTKAALITRGIVEMQRYGEFLGANGVTFSGLSGLGDLIVTCGSQHSRNRHVGEELGKGKSLETVLEEMVMVAEGVPTLKAIYQQVKEHDIYMPILEATYKVVYEGEKPENLVEDLMTKSTKGEFISG